MEEFPAFQCQFSVFKTAGPEGGTQEGRDILGGRRLHGDVGVLRVVSPKQHAQRSG